MTSNNIRTMDDVPGLLYPFHHSGITGTVKITPEGKLYAELDIPTNIALPFKLAISNRETCTLTRHGHITLGFDTSIKQEPLSVVHDNNASLKHRIDAFKKSMLL